MIDFFNDYFLCVLIKEKDFVLIPCTYAWFEVLMHVLAILAAPPPLTTQTPFLTHTLDRKQHSSNEMIIFIRLKGKR